MISSILKQTGVDLIQEWIPREATTIKLEEDDSDEDGEHYKDAPEDKVNSPPSNDFNVIDTTRVAVLLSSEIFLYPSGPNPVRGS